MPSAVLLSVLIHVALFLLAGMLVVFTVVKKDEKKFEPPKAVERPKMKLKKPKVKVRKTSKPKPTTRIVTKMNRSSMPDIQLPEMSGMETGLGGGMGGFDLMPDLGDISVFGSGQSIGNDFEGVLYDLKRDRQGRNIAMGEEQFKQVLRDFIKEGWKPSVLARYYRSPKKLYATHFMMPPLPSPMAPDDFGVPDMPCTLFMLHYKGQLVSSKPITFRFRANGNAFLFARVDGKEVVLACWDAHKDYFDWWQSSSADSLKYYLGDQLATVGDWITLEPGKPLDMEVMFGEWKGGYMAAMLTVEVQGVEYETNRQGGPILPAFKTEELSRDTIDEIEKYLPANEACLTNGPVFRDYDLPSIVVEKEEITVEPSVIAPELYDSNDTESRAWTLANARTIDAEFISLVGKRVTLKNTKGKLIKVQKKNLSAEDLEYIQLASPPQLNISFSKQSTQRSYLPDLGNKPPPASFYYNFSAKIKQTSPGDYNQILHAELFTIGAEIGGNRNILLDRAKGDFTLSAENEKFFRLMGNTVEVSEYVIKDQQRGQKYASYLVVITDSRGKIIAYKTPKKWLFENLENLKQIPVGRYFDKSCTRVSPTPPKPFSY